MTAIRKPEDERRDDQPHRPIRDFEKWKNLGRDLDQDPSDHDVSDRDAIHFAPFQFGEEILQRRAAGTRARVQLGHRELMTRVGGSGKSGQTAVSFAKNRCATLLRFSLSCKIPIGASRIAHWQMRRAQRPSNTSVAINGRRFTASPSGVVILQAMPRTWYGDFSHLF